MTDLREAAERIFRYFEPRAELCIDVNIDYVESILREVVQDARDEASEAKFEAVIMAARSEMREQAAKIAERCDYHANDLCECVRIAKSIRALKP